jgi:hypothetical protein
MSRETPRICQINNATKSSYLNRMIVEETFDYWELIDPIHSVRYFSVIVLVAVR